MECKKIRFFAAFTFIFMILTAVFSLPSFAVDPVPDMSGAASVYLYNIEQKKAMAEKDPAKQVYPASTVKLMTGLIATEMLSQRLGESVTITDEMLKGVTGNNMKLKVGEKVKIADLLYGALLGGANDACTALAVICSGSTSDFIALMNKRAEELGALDTYYTNVTGMHNDAMVTTAYDTFLIAKATSESSLFLSITSESRYQMDKTNLSEARNIYSKNYLISRYSETKYFNKYAKGLNSGSTTQGGYCLAAYTENEGQSYICVVLGAEVVGDEIGSYNIANSLLNWAYGSYGYVEVLSDDRLICEVAVELSEDIDHVTLRPAEALTVFLPLDIDLESALTYNHKINSPSLEAPVSEGQVAGFISVELDGEILGSVDLVTMNSVERSEFLYSLKKIRNFTTSRPFVITVICFLVLFLIYILATALGKNDRNARRRYRRKRRRR